jgi:hypothetical protein
MKVREYMGVPDSCEVFVCRDGETLCMVPANELDRKYSPTKGIPCLVVDFAKNVQSVGVIEWPSKGDWSLIKTEKPGPISKQHRATYEEYKKNIPDGQFGVIEADDTLKVLKLRNP